MAKLYHKKSQSQASKDRAFVETFILSEVLFSYDLQKNVLHYYDIIGLFELDNKITGSYTKHIQGQNSGTESTMFQIAKSHFLLQLRPCIMIIKEK